MMDVELENHVFKIVSIYFTFSDKGPDMWVEIIEPKSRERMFANLNTGECVWDEPEVSIFFYTIQLFG